MFILHLLSVPTRIHDIFSSRTLLNIEYMTMEKNDNAHHHVSIDIYFHTFIVSHNNTLIRETSHHSITHENNALTQFYSYIRAQYSHFSLRTTRFVDSNAKSLILQHNSFLYTRFAAALLPYRAKPSISSATLTYN